MSTDTKGGAHEAVARAIAAVVLDRETDHWDLWTPETDAALAALRPFIAAEIRAWVESEKDRLMRDEYNQPTRRVPNAYEALESLHFDADAIANRITTTAGGQQ